VAGAGDGQGGGERGVMSDRWQQIEELYHAAREDPPQPTTLAMMVIGALGMIGIRWITLTMVNRGQKIRGLGHTGSYSNGISVSA